MATEEVIVPYVSSRERKCIKRQPGEMSILAQLAINPVHDKQLRPVELKLEDEEGQLLQLMERPIDMDEVRQRQTDLNEIEADIAELSMSFL